jgi:protein-S-isoprenylcysteine O-methyltransferase Ste14
MSIAHSRPGGESNRLSHLALKAFGSLLIMLLLMGTLLFLTAGTLAYWQAWVFLGVYGLSTLVIIAYLLLRDPGLLVRRLSGGPFAETRTSEKLIMSLASLEFVALLVVPALDRRFGWSAMSWYVAICGNVIVALGWLVVFLVFRANTYAAATIGVAADQTVISTGPYAIVRHPMYSGSLLYVLGVPLALGSWWGLLVVPVLLLTLIWRLFDEEAVLQERLAGYADYARTVCYRLIPCVW